MFRKIGFLLSCFYSCPLCLGQSLSFRVANYATRAIFSDALLSRLQLEMN